MTDLDLIRFLYERFDEEEAAAKLVPRPYRLYIYDDGVMAEPEEYDAFDDQAGQYKQDADGDDVLPNRHCGYALLYDPDKTLREVAAKRKIVDRFRRSTLLRSHPGGKKVGDKYYFVLRSTLAVIAAVYAEHPDYRAELFAPDPGGEAPDGPMDEFEAADEIDRRGE
jgi:hypothetical protein